MKAKIKHIEEGVVLVSDQLLFANLEDGAEVEISVRGNSIVITPVANELFRASAEKVIEKHSGLFKRLAGS